MSAGAEQALQSAIYTARARRVDLTAAQRQEREATVRFMDEALSHGWSWERIGGELNVTATGARRYYYRNRRLVHGG